MRTSCVVAVYGKTVAISMCLGGNVYAEFASKELSHNLCALFVHFVDTGTAVDLSDLALLVVVLNNRHGGLLVYVFEGDKSFGRKWGGREITHGIAS